MLITISPAKSLDMDPVAVTPTQPAFQADAIRLSKTMRGQTITQLRKLMDISQDLARLNRDRFQAFTDDPAPEATKPAALAFNGDTYQGLEAKTLSDDDMRYAQDHLCILSGLYGLLRPLDAIQPYRLEMGSRLKTRRGKSLYDYWGDTLAKALNTRAAEAETDTLINCASNEYFTAANRKSLKLRVITPQFLELKDDRARMVSFFAKRARGAMARYVIENRIKDSADINGFTAGGYAWDAEASTPDAPVFVRDYPQAA